MQKPSGIADVDKSPLFSKIGVSLLILMFLTLMVESPALAVVQGEKDPSLTEESSTGRGQAVFPTPVTEDGYVSQGYDVFVWCGNVSAGVDEESVRAEFEASSRAVAEGALDGSEAPDTREIRTRMEEESARQVEACREAGFRTAGDVTAGSGSAPAPQGVLPDTGGAPAALLRATGLLLAGLIVARRKVVRRRPKPGWTGGRLL